MIRVKPDEKLIALIKKKFKVKVKEYHSFSGVSFKHIAGYDIQGKEFEKWYEENKRVHKIKMNGEWIENDLYFSDLQARHLRQLLGEGILCRKIDGIGEGHLYRVRQNGLYYIYLHDFGFEEELTKEQFELYFEEAKND